MEATQGDRPVWSFVKSQCLHCQEPACASVCPVGALRKTAEGPVIYDFEALHRLPLLHGGLPLPDPEVRVGARLLPIVQKCTFCAERIKDGVSPACIKTCPTGTMLFGEREEMLALAKTRLEKGKGKYVPHIYGEKEAGGTSWIYISAVPFAEIWASSTQVPLHALPPLTWNYISKIPYVMGGVLAFGAASWYVTRRKDVQEKEGPR